MKTPRWIACAALLLLRVSCGDESSLRMDSLGRDASVSGRGTSVSDSGLRDMGDIWKPWPSGRVCYGLPGEGCSGPAKPPAAARLRFRHSDRCVDVSGTAKGAVVQQWSCHEEANQRFWFVHQGYGNYQVVDHSSGLCLDVSQGSTTDGTLLLLWDCHSGVNQRFRLVPIDAGWVVLRAQHSGSCAAARNGLLSDGVAVIQESCDNGPSQQLRFD